MSFDEKKYSIDGEPASARDLIHAAEALDAEFGADGLTSTSQAARILRDHGHEVR